MRSRSAATVPGREAPGESPGDAPGKVPDEAPEQWSTQQWEAVRQAVLQERARVHPEEVAEPETALGRDIKNQMGAPTALVDEIVRQGGEETLRKLPRPRKPH